MQFTLVKLFKVVSKVVWVRVIVNLLFYCYFVFHLTPQQICTWNIFI